jgi:hypothetical protein
LVAGVLATACQQELPVETDPAVPAGCLKLVNGDRLDTRASADDFTGEVAWTDGDRVAVYVDGAGYQNLPLDLDGEGGAFVSPTVETGQARANFAVYPAASADPDHVTGSNLRIVYPDSYDLSGMASAARDVFSPLPMVAVNDPASSVLTFHQVGGLLRLQLRDVPASVRTLQLTFDGVGVTGTYQVTGPATATPAASPVGGSAYGSVVSFVLAAEGQTLGTEQDLVLNIPLPPGDYSAFTGVTVRALNVDGTAAVARQFTHETGAWSSISRTRGRRLFSGFESSSPYGVFPSLSELAVTPSNPSASNAGTATFTLVSSVEDKDGVSTASPWTVEYSADGSSWGAPPSGFVVPSSGSGSTSGETITVTVPAGTTTAGGVMDVNTEIRGRLLSNAGAYAKRGSSDSPWNLSNPSDGSISRIAESANTYIVNAPGWYCFPLVMGNGVVGNAKNSVAYQQTNFVNYKGSAITSPFLQDQGGTPTAAYVVWEEADMVELTDRSGWTLPDDGCITSSSVTIDGVAQTVYWLNFRILEDYIKQGCIVLAVTDGTDVMWSWTVWVTDYVPANYPDYADGGALSDVECTYDAAGHKVTFMPRNLGWVEGETRNSNLYAAGTYYLRFKSTADASVSSVVTITRPELRVPVSSGSALSNSHHPYYQWGRKEAMLPSKGTSTDVLSPLYGSATSFQRVNNQTTMAVAIKTPDKFYTNHGDWCSTNDNGWWCAGNTVTDTDKKTVKTIYDPCPAGYTIPRHFAYGGFGIGSSGPDPFSAHLAANGTASSADIKGYYIWSGYRSSSSDPTAGMKTVFIPASGVRQYTNGEPIYVNSRGYYRTAVPTSAAMARGVVFYLTGGSPMFQEPNGNRANGFAVRPAREEL